MCALLFLNLVKPIFLIKMWSLRGYINNVSKQMPKATYVKEPHPEEKEVHEKKQGVSLNYAKIAEDTFNSEQH